jgi:hypothetical protein
VSGRRTTGWFDRLRTVFGRPLAGQRNRQPPRHDPTPSRDVAERPPKATDSAVAAHPSPPRAPNESAPPPAGVAPGAEAAPAPPATPAVPGDRDTDGADGDHETDGAGGAAPDVEPPSGAPRVRVHEERLDRRVAPLELSPTEAVRLAREGRGSLVRRELPPDEALGGSDRDQV